MLHVLISVNNDLIAAEAKYHKTCFASYISNSNLKHMGFKEIAGEASYDTAFKEIAAEIISIGEDIVFHQHPDRSKPEVIYSRNISPQDVLNASAAQNSRSVSNVSF